MNGNENQIKIFEFTEKEKSSIQETIFELTEIMCILVAQGVKIENNGEKPIDFIQIIKHIIGEERKNELNFAHISTAEHNGKILINGMLEKDSREFLSNLLTHQLKTLEIAIPRAIEFAKLHGNFIEGGTNVYALPESKIEKST